MTPLSEAERFARLRLARTDRVGPVAFSQLLQRYGSAERALDALPDLIRNRGRSGYAIPAPDAVEAELEAGARIGAQLILWGEAAYPEALAAVDPPPPLLWTLGDPALMRRPCMAIVGARIASAGGQRIARGLAQQLGESGHVVVSGLARGVDAAAHLGALDTGTIAVLGGGVDDVYPSDNADLYRQIAERGCIVSESPVGARAQARDFPRRNRIISGLCLGVVVVEAARRSGSLITARLALDQGREVFAVPGSPRDPRSHGPNGLLRQGAVLTERAEDVLEALEPMLRQPLTEREAIEYEAPPGPPPSEQEFDSAREIVTTCLSPTPVAVDEIIRQCHMTPAVVLMVLLELELAGRIERQPGNRVATI